MKRGIRTSPRHRVLAVFTLSMILLAGLAWAGLHVCVQAPVAASVPLPEPSPAAPASENAHPPVRLRRSRRPYCYTVLLSGVDDAGGGSDTNLLLRFDEPLQRIDLVSLPRDTLLHHEWYSNKLNYAYASGGTRLLRKEVENLLGIPVDFSVTINLQGFIALVDSLGGIDFEIPADMDYDDSAQNLHIHYARGLCHLNGQQAMEVVRWRKNNDGSGYADADIGRIATQQQFLRVLARKVMTAGSIPALVQLFTSHVQTDLSAGNLVWMGSKALEIGMDGIYFHTLPGNGAGYYRGESVYVPDPDATLTLVNEVLNPYDHPITLEELDILVP